jgi:V/A-type H+-transporting ATPase subunit A
MLDLILHFHERAERIIRRGAPISVLHDLPVVTDLIRMKTSIPNDRLEGLEELRRETDRQMDALEAQYA